MKQGDFHVLDDNKPPELIRSFNSETNLPLQVGLLIDASNSVRDRFKFEQESAIEFLNQTIRPRFDQAFVVGFDVTPEITQDFTDNTELLAHGVHELRPGGGTALYDALYFACRDKLMKAPKSTTVRRAIILLSDGDDNQSHVTREEAIEMAQRAEAIVYTISTNVSGTSGPGDTCHLDVADRWGNVVSATPSGGWLQSSPVIPALGFCLGTRGQMFTLTPGRPATIAPGKRPRTTLTPTLALRDGEPALAFGTPGGDQQDQWTLAFFLNHAVFGMNLQQAIDFPAFHSAHMPSSFYPRESYPLRLDVEERVGPEVIAELRGRGHVVNVRPAWSLGRVSAVARSGGFLYAGANPRGMQGYAAGR